MSERYEQGGRDQEIRVVDDFFASHRRRVVDHGADEATWQAIRERTGRGSRRSGGMWFLAGAVAASAVTVAVLVGQGFGGPQATPAGPAPSADPVVATASVPPPATSPQEPDEPNEPVEDAATEGPDAHVDAAEPTGDRSAPDLFALPAPDPEEEILLVREPTGEDGDLRTTTYDVECAAGEVEWHCPGLAVSEDGGRTWTARVDMFEAGYYAAVSSRDRTWMWAAGGERPGVPQVQRGLVRSDDGGRTWREVPTRGDHVLWAEIFRSTLVVVTDGCASGSEGDCVEVVITDVGDDDATNGRRLVTIDDLPPLSTGVPQPIPDGGLQATYDAVYVHMPWRDVSYRIADGEEVATPVKKPGCVLSTAPESPDTLLARCGGASLQLSVDGGQTWKEIEGPGGNLAAAASNDGRRLAVAATDGLWVRDGGGAGWDQVMIWTPPARDRLDALGGQSMRYGGPYRSYPLGDPGLSQRWTTHDDWETWTEEPSIEITRTD